MTPQERTHPEVLNTSRRRRIASGSGTSIQEVNKLIKQFDRTRKMMKMVTGANMKGMMGRMKNMKGTGMPPHELVLVHNYMVRARSLYIV